MKIINVDKNGNEMKNVDWSVFERERIEEIVDENGKVTAIISHCRKMSDAEIHLNLMIEYQKNLAQTDYISSKCLDAFLNCTSVADIFNVIGEFRTKYSDIIEKRRSWREKIDEIESMIMNEKGKV